MKALSILLAVYIWFLSVHPIAIKITPDSIVSSEEKTCTTSYCEEMEPECAENSDSEESNSCYPAGLCNSSSVCICGLYCFCCVLQTPSHLFTTPEYSAKLNATGDRRLISNYHSDCFHPPEIV